MERRACELRGVVQGVGMRPLVVRLARERELSGWVQNRGSHVALEVQGSRAALASFLLELRRAPLPARVESLRCRRSVVQEPDHRFEVRESPAGAPDSMPLPADLRVCDECLAEMDEPGARRHGYPFVACARCGPRYTLVRGLPYDRSRTSMVDFPLCEACRREHADVGDRRFHAVPMACAACGPTARLLDPTGRQLEGGDAAVRRAATLLREGRILAVKGVGGFQLLCDAQDERVVARLRERKRRPRQPFALLARDLGVIDRFARCGALERRELQSPAGPIVLLAPKDDAPPAVRPATNVAPGVPRVGVMLPTSGLHLQLVRSAGRLLVCTSGNLHDEPIELHARGAIERLAEVADAFLDHDREVVRRADDSVVQVVAGRVQALRLGRGLAPWRGRCPGQAPTRLCVGAHTKNAPALAREGELVLWPHVGDLQGPAARDAFEEALSGLTSLLRCEPQQVVCDAHPDYASTLWAEQSGLPLRRVHHHEAHVGAVLAEHGVESALGFAFDGVGLGTDGKAWGGEALEVRAGTPARRAAHLWPFALPGASRASREPCRVLAGMRHAAGLPTGERFGALLSASSPATSTAAGRWLEGFAALLTGCQTASYEGEAASALEQLAHPGAEPYGFTLRGGILDWRPALRQAEREGADAVLVASRVHATLAAMIERVAITERTGTVALAGGCFQNRVLVEETVRRLDAHGIRWLLPERLPPGDGALAVGQAWLTGASAPTPPPAPASTQ